LDHRGRKASQVKLVSRDRKVVLAPKETKGRLDCKVRGGKEDQQGRREIKVGLELKETEGIQDHKVRKEKLDSLVSRERKEKLASKEIRVK
jgi:hypothetical protein